MKTMIKIFSIGLCAAMLTGSALAEGTLNSEYAPSETQPNGQQIQEQYWQGQPPEMPGMNRQNQQGQPPQMPGGMSGMNGPFQQGQPPAMPSSDQNSDQQNGLPQEIPGSNGQDQQGQPPEMPSDNQNSDRQNGLPPEMPGTDSGNDNSAVVQTGNNGKLKMRRGPSQGSRIDSYLKNGTEVEVLEVLDEWVKIRVNGKEGYVMIDFLEGNLQAQEESGQSDQQEGQPPEMPEMNGQNQQGQPPAATPAECPAECPEG